MVWAKIPVLFDTEEMATIPGIDEQPVKSQCEIARLTVYSLIIEIIKKQLPLFRKEVQYKLNKVLQKTGTCASYSS